MQAQIDQPALLIRIARLYRLASLLFLPPAYRASSSAPSAWLIIL